jgi:hypothetical protein
MHPQRATTDMPELYDEDFFEWTRRNARLLRAGQLHRTDLQHVAEEIEDLGKQDLKELNRRARALLAHLLIWQLQSGKRPKSSLRSIAIERIELKGLLKHSPSLKSKLAGELRNTHVRAVRRAMAKTAARRERFPAECPFTIDQILDLDFLPTAPERGQVQFQRARSAAELSDFHDRDFFEWTRRNAELLRAGRLEQADIQHLAEEIEDIGKRDLGALDRRVQVLLIHLLKRRFQPEKRSRSWENAVTVQRIGVERLLRRYPSFRRMIKMDLAGNYKFAVRFAVIETGLPKIQFPAECPFTVEQILDPEFVP